MSFKLRLTGCALVLAMLLMPATSCERQDGWQLVWEEEFAWPADSLGYGVQCGGDWSKIRRGDCHWNNYMSDYDSCYALRDGCIVLRGIRNNSLANDTAPYLTGGVTTKWRRSFGNGRIETRAKLNGASGAWPAIWMMPAGRNDWPDCGEIDIMEHLNSDSIVYQTVHTHYTYDLGIKLSPLSGAVAPINPGEFNVYAVERYSDSIVFFVNDVCTLSYPRVQTDVPGQFPFSDSEFYLLIDMQLGGDWVGEVNPADLPVEMYVDWVRYYTKVSL